MFKRRDRRSFIAAFIQAFYPRGGWMRAFEYVKHRVRRLPGTPEFIARGVFIGVFVCFTPFFGLHMVLAAILALLFNASILAALIGTFLGNPLTYVLIGVMAINLGNFILGQDANLSCADASMGAQFWQAIKDLWYNFMAIFSTNTAEWESLGCFFANVFLPYMLGGLIPGLIAGAVSYFICLPIIRVYQKRRLKRLKKRGAG